MQLLYEAHALLTKYVCRSLSALWHHKKIREFVERDLVRRCTLTVRTISKILFSVCQRNDEDSNKYKLHVAK